MMIQVDIKTAQARTAICGECGKKCCIDVWNAADKCPDGKWHTSELEVLYSERVSECVKCEQNLYGRCQILCCEKYTSWLFGIPVAIPENKRENGIEQIAEDPRCRLNRR